MVEAHLRVRRCIGLQHISPGAAVINDLGIVKPQFEERRLRCILAQLGLNDGGEPPAGRQRHSGGRDHRRGGLARGLVRIVPQLNPKFIAVYHQR